MVEQDLALQMDQLVAQLKQVFLKNKKTLAVAESCTGGLLASSITKEAGVSAFFLGAVVSYNKSVKNQMLGVDMNSIRVMGEVSEVVAKQMAQGVSRNLAADWAVSVTGIAGPDGGRPGKPVGTVCFAVVGPGIVHTTRQHFSGSRLQVQNQSVIFILRWLLALMKDPNIQIRK